MSVVTACYSQVVQQIFSRVKGVCSLIFDNRKVLQLVFQIYLGRLVKAQFASPLHRGWRAQAVLRVL